MKTGRTIAAVVLLLLGSVVAAHAQSATTTGQIRGRVTDQAGAPVTGVSVIAKNIDTGAERGGLTDKDGVYVIRLLQVGTYSVRSSMLGFASKELPGVRVTLGSTATANLQITPQAVQLGSITVSTERPAVDAAHAAVVQSVSRAEIENLPVLGRDFTDFINLSGLVAPDPGATTGGQFSIAGQRASQTNLQIDGVDANNAFFGENRGGSRIPFVFSLESIQEFQVITNGYDVEYGNYSGGIVNVITRGGTNNLRGSVYGNYRSDALTSRGFLDTMKLANFEVQHGEASLSGPIVRDKAFFNFSAEAERRREPQTPLTISQYLPGGAREDATVAAEIQRFWAALENKYGATNAAGGYEPFQTSNDAITLFGRIDWNINPKNHLSVRHNFSAYNNDHEFDDNFDFQFGASRAERIQSHSNSLVSELQTVFNDKTFNVARFQWSTESRPRNGANIRPALAVTLSNGDVIAYGGTFVGFNNDMHERKFQLIDNFTKVFDNHTIKLGANGIFTHNFNSFLPAISAACGARGSQGAGIFCFSDIASFEAQKPSAYRFNVLQGTGNPVPQSDFDVAEYAVYAQDEWRATDKLTVTAGIRHDRENFSTQPGRVIDVERAFGFETGNAPTDNNNISPRLSLAYDVNGNGLTVARAGAGYFFGRVPYVLGGNVIGSQDPIFNLTCTGNPLTGDANAPPSVTDYANWSATGFDNPTNCAGAGGFSGVPTYTIWSKDFNYPETFKANVGVEKVFGRARVSTDFIYSRSTNLYTVRNLNLRPAQFQLASEGNRNVYTPAALFSPGSANTEGSRIYSTLGNVFVNYNDGRAEAKIATIEGDYKLTNNISLRGSYTYTRAFDNSSYSCCEATAGFSNPEVGARGPNDIGSFGDTDGSWGPSGFSRDHTFILSGFTTLPLGIQLAANFRVQSGRPYTPEISGDINGDGVSFNDRPFIYAVADLPVSSTGANADSARARYARVLGANECLSKYVGQIIPRGTCRTPWTNSLDMRLTKNFNTLRNQHAELQIDLFNVLNGIGTALCDGDEANAAIRNGTNVTGACGLGRVTTVSGANRNIYTVGSFNSATNSITYAPSTNFGKETVIGSNLNLQFQTQIALKYYF
jgi:outer membrane receptor for ferrienterochelin and colicin